MFHLVTFTALKCNGFGGARGTCDQPGNPDVSVLHRPGDLRLGREKDTKSPTDTFWSEPCSPSYIYQRVLACLPIWSLFLSA